ncbi:hypothetical protein KYLE_12 [Pantoea phage Kyle]|uniref:Uncharacterized protein n=1 Tax=Pantoea phage Kyle TaxID=2589665 RepID=A0A514A8J1_9CAUD|nr:hypothetical protein HWC52_gp012 [Pantoea phage Kyle]QDH49581.1 hypothetical protein KYLE_12 [Pantoea phage Kyle]
MWIMLFVYMSYPQMETPMIEFTSQEKCEAAIPIVQETLVDAAGYLVKASCFEK